MMAHSVPCLLNQLSQRLFSSVGHYTFLQTMLGLTCAVMVHPEDRENNAPNWGNFYHCHSLRSVKFKNGRDEYVDMEL